TAAPLLSVEAVHLKPVERSLAVSCGRLCAHHHCHHPLRRGGSIRPGEANTGNVRAWCDIAAIAYKDKHTLYGQTIRHTYTAYPCRISRMDIPFPIQAI